MRLLLYEYCCVQSDADPAGLALLHEGWGMLRALVEDLSRSGSHRLVGLASPALEARLRQYPGVEVVPTQPEDDLEQLAEWAPRVDACLVVAPEFRGLLVERVETVRAAGGRSLNCEPEAIRLASDKLALGAGLAWGRVPPAERWTPGLVWTHFPAVLKPIDGAGSQETYRVENATELRRAAEAARAAGWPDLMVQLFVPGVAASVCWLAGEGTSIALPATEQILSTDGRFHYRGARYPLGDTLAFWVDDLHLPGLRGWVGIDMVLGPEGHFLIELNPRLTTSYLALRQRCRGNLAEALVAVALGDPVPPLEWDSAPLELRLD